MIRKLRALPVATLIAALLVLGSSATHGELRPARPGAAPGMINLPYMVNDNTGNQWMIYQGGWLRHQGNMPLYSQAAMLLINGNQAQSNVNQVRQDEKTGELIFENLNVAGINVTRRILVKADEGYVRYIDIVKNTQGQDQSINIAYQTNFNYGIATSSIIREPKGKERPLAWVAQLQPGRALMEVYGGRGAKSFPDIQFMPENNMVRASAQITIPAGKEIAFVHLHGTANTQDAAAEFVSSMKDSKLLSDVPQALRKIIVNFSTSGGYIDDREILRGDMFDVVELRGGDMVNGTLKEHAYKLETFYGTIELPAERVVGLMNTGQFRPRQLVVTVDGEVFGGKLSKETIEVELSSGQVTHIPLSQISRLGYRKRPGEAEEWTFSQPMVLLRSGDRIGIAMPNQPIEVLTRYGLLKLSANSLSAISFQAEEHGVHQVHLTDGSAFAGLVSSPQFDVTLSSPAGQAVSFPSAALRRLQLVAEVTEVDEDESPTVKLSNNDLLVGRLSGRLKLDTAFDTLSLDAAEIRGMSRAPDSGLDVQVMLWDLTTVSGQLQEPQITCDLLSGIQVTIPIALLEHYSNPNPKPADSMIERIKSVVGELSAEDWRQREQAEAQLIAMGDIVVGVLRELQHSQPPEAQQRIESVLKQLGKNPTPPPPMPIDQ